MADGTIQASLAQEMLYSLETWIYTKKQSIRNGISGNKIKMKNIFFSYLQLL